MKKKAEEKVINMRKEIGKRITTIRNNFEMPQNEFAKLLGITPQYLSTLEMGINCLSVEKIISLSKKTNISTDYILLGKEPIINEENIKEITNINQEQLDSCLLIIKSILDIIKKTK